MMLNATVWVQLELVMLLEGNLAASTRGTLLVLQEVGLILCGQTSQISVEGSASAGVFFLISS